MSTLAVVEEILRETASPLSVREIVQRAGIRLPSKSKTPDTVVARDLAMDIKRQGESSRFVRAAPGRYTLRQEIPSTTTEFPFEVSSTLEMSLETSPLATSALRQERDTPLPAKRRDFLSVVPAPARLADQAD